MKKAKGGVGTGKQAGGEVKHEGGRQFLKGGVVPSSYLDTLGIGPVRIQENLNSEIPNKKRNGRMSKKGMVLPS